MPTRTGAFNPVFNPTKGRAGKRGAALGPYLAAPAGGSTNGALRLGSEASSPLFQGSSIGGQYLAGQSGAFGTAGYRAVQIPMPNIPTTGDCYMGIFFRTSAFGTNVNAVETLLSVQGQAANSNFGGTVQWLNPGLYANSGVGEEIAATAGFIQISRSMNNSAFRLWGASASPVVTTLGPVLVDSDWLLIIGIIGSSSVSEMILVNVATGAASTVTSALTGTRFAAPLFNQIGAIGTASASVQPAGFGGSVSDVFFAGAGSTFPTTAQAQAIASGATPISGLAGLVNWWPLDASTISGTSIAAQPGLGSPATIIGANLLPAAPIRKPSNITINRLGAHWVFPLACGATSGVAWIEGTAPAGTVINGQLIYAGGGSSAVVQGVANGSNKYAIPITSPAPAPFYRRASAANGDPSNTVIDFDIMDVGVVVHVFGQSECDRLSTSSQTMSTSPPTPVATGNTGCTLAMPGSYAGPWASYVDLINHTGSGYGSVRADAAQVRPEIMLGWGYPGDGLTAAAAASIARTGYSHMIVYTTRSGHNMDCALLDGQTFTQVVTTSLALTAATVNAKFGTSGYIMYPGFLNGVRPGSVSLTWANGGSPVTVTDSGYTYADASTAPTVTCTGSGFTVTINCFTGAMTFSGTVPTGTLTATWTVKQETEDAAYVNKTANINGFGVRESFDRVGNMALRYGASFIWTQWVTANGGDSGIVTAQAINLGVKYTLLRCMAYGLPCPDGNIHWPGYLGAGLALGASVSVPPMVIAPKGRETSSTYYKTYCALDTCRQAQASLWPGGANALSFALQGSWYFDYAVEVATSPHEDNSVKGGQRIGRRAAADWQAAITVNSAYVDAPTWGLAVFSGGSVGAYTTITVPLSAAWKTRNPTLKLVVASGGNSAALDEWYYGGTDSLTGLGNAAGTLIDNSTNATAALASDGLSVIITAMGSTTWAGTELVRSVIGAPGPVQTAPLASVVYDNRGGFGVNEPGLLASPKFL